MTVESLGYKLDFPMRVESPSQCPLHPIFDHKEAQGSPHLSHTNVDARILCVAYPTSEQSITLKANLYYGELITGDKIYLRELRYY
jgi:hypothetical protein